MSSVKPLQSSRQPPACPPGFLASPLMSDMTAFHHPGGQPGKWLTAGPTFLPLTLSALDWDPSRSPGREEYLCTARSPFSRECGFLLPAGIAKLSVLTEAVFDLPVFLFEHPVKHLMSIKMCILYIILQ